jgi:hypothetical protein
VKLQNHEFSQVSVSKFKSKSWAITCQINIPMMKSLGKITEGTELVMEFEPETKKSNARKRTWKEDAQQEDANSAREHQQVARVRERNRESKSPGQQRTCPKVFRPMENTF